MNKYGVTDKVLKEIIDFANKNNVKKLILYGSRARGDFDQTSDIDLAVIGGDQTNFYFNIKEETSTLLSFDIVDLEKCLDSDFLNEINKDGVLLYEKR